MTFQGKTGANGMVTKIVPRLLSQEQQRVRIDETEVLLMICDNL